MKKNFCKLLFLLLSVFLSSGMTAETIIAAGNGDGLILLEGGTFTMGAPETERQHQADEVRHQVTISPFYIDPYEVTQADYLAVTGENPSYFHGDRLPVDSVSWYDAINYCNLLSVQNGLTPVYSIDGSNVTWDRSANGFRLLTEAEWEYAVRAGSDAIFYEKNQIHSDDINFHGSYPYLVEENYSRTINSDVRTSRYRGTTIDVDSLAPNAFGLYNMLGNVSEWVWDYYGEYELNAADPAGPLTGTLRVNRGGSYIDFGKHLRMAYRSATTPIDTDRNLGFRIARNAEPLDQIVETKPAFEIPMPDDPRILIVYYSYSGNTRKAANILKDYLGADLVEIVMEDPYRGNIYDVSQADTMNDIHPPILTKVNNIEDYDVILLGYPTWWATIPMPVMTFLDETDLSGKIICTFSSHGETMFGDSISDLSKAEPNAYIAPAFEFNYGGGNDLRDRLINWLRENEVID